MSRYGRRPALLRLQHRRKPWLRDALPRDLLQVRLKGLTRLPPSIIGFVWRREAPVRPERARACASLSHAGVRAAPVGPASRVPAQVSNSVQRGTHHDDELALRSPGAGALGNRHRRRGCVRAPTSQSGGQARSRSQRCCRQAGALVAKSTLPGRSSAKCSAAATRCRWKPSRRTFTQWSGVTGCPRK